MKIEIEGLKSPEKFVKDWSNTYYYRLENKYSDNIDKGLDDDCSMEELFKWKNGTEDKISKGKTSRVKDFISKRNELKKLKEKFSWDKYEELIQPQKGSVIWKIFLLHIINPIEFPIYDQHVYRSFRFFTKGVIIEERPKKDKEYYETYKNEYLPWFNQLKKDYKLEPRMMDKSFFSFGKLLKNLYKKPITIKK